MKLCPHSPIRLHGKVQYVYNRTNAINITVKWLPQLLRIYEVPGSNLGPETGFQDVTCFHQALHTQMLGQYPKKRYTITTCFRIISNYSFVIPSSNAIQSQLRDCVVEMRHKSTTYDEMCDCKCYSVCSLHWQNFVIVFHRYSLAHLRCL